MIRKRANLMSWWLRVGPLTMSVSHPSRSFRVQLELEYTHSSCYLINNLLSSRLPSLYLSIDIPGFRPPAIYSPSSTLGNSSRICLIPGKYSLQLCDPISVLKSQYTMCVGFWCLEHPDYALYAAFLIDFKVCTCHIDFRALYSILCSNRDESLSRPTTEAHFHNFGPEIESGVQDGFVLSGRDLRAGGTWLGINRDSGRIALLYVAQRHWLKW